MKFDEAQCNVPTLQAAYSVFTDIVSETRFSKESVYKLRRIKNVCKYYYYSSIGITLLILYIDLCVLSAKFISCIFNSIMRVFLVRGCNYTLI